MSAVRWRRSRVCAGFHSAPVRRSLERRMGDASVVVVIIYSPCDGVSPFLRGGGFAGPRLRSGLRDCCQNLFEQTEKFFYLSPSDEERREEAQSEIVGAIDEQAAAHGFGDEGAAIDEEFDAGDEAFAAHFADEGEFLGEGEEAFAQFRAAGGDVLEEFFVLEDVQKFEGRGACQRAAAEGGAVEAGRNAGGNGFRGEDGAERKA